MADRAAGKRWAVASRRTVAKLAPAAGEDVPAPSGAAVVAELTALSLVELMDLPVRPAKRGDGEDGAAALPDDLTALDLADLLALSLSGDELTDPQETLAVAPAAAAPSEAGNPPADAQAEERAPVSGGAGVAVQALLSSPLGPFDDPGGGVFAGLFGAGSGPALVAAGPLVGIPGAVSASVTFEPADSAGGALLNAPGPAAVGNGISPPNRIVGPGFHAGTDGVNVIVGTSLSEGRGGEEILFGALGDDQLIGNGNEDRLLGGVGNDSLDGGAGNDILIGGAGNDVGLGGSQGDLYLFQQGSGSDSFSGGGGLDGILLIAPGGGAPALADWSLQLAAGSATWGASQVNLTPGATGRVLFGDGSTIAFDGVEVISWASSYGVDGGNSLVRVAAAGGDSLIGGTREDTLFGSAGDDLLQGGSNEDLLLGHAGDDLLFGGSQNDLLLGGDGRDALDGGAGNDLLDGGNGADILFGGAGNDRLIWDFNDSLIDGGSGNDTLQIDADGLDLSAFGAALRSIEVLDFEADAADNWLRLDAADVLGLSGSGTLTVLGGLGDAVDAGRGWTDGGLVGGFQIFTQAGATLRLDVDLAVNPDILL